MPHGQVDQDREEHVEDFDATKVAMRDVALAASLSIADTVNLPNHYETHCRSLVNKGKRRKAWDVATARSARRTAELTGEDSVE